VNSPLYIKKIITMYIDFTLGYVVLSTHMHTHTHKRDLCLCTSVRNEKENDVVLRFHTSCTECPIHQFVNGRFAVGDGVWSETIFFPEYSGLT
jgi:hypothetical protein